MAFSNSPFSKPKSRQASTKWVDLQPRERKAPGLKRVGKKSEWWMFINHILETFYVRIGLPRMCEIKGDFHDGYHVAKAHSRRRQDIKLGDYYYALRTCWACQTCHSEVDQKGRRAAEPIIEGIIVDRFTRMGLSPARVKELLLEVAAEIQAENPGKYDQYLVVF